MPHACKLVDDVSNKAGLEHDAASLIREIAISHIDEGATTLEEVVKLTQKDIPGAKEVDIWNSLGRRIPRNDKKTRSVVQKRIANLESEARLTAQIDDALKGIAEDKKKGKVPPQKIRDMRAQLRALQRDIASDTRDEAQKARLITKIEEVREALRDDVVKIDEKQDAKMREDVQQLNDELKDLRSQLQTKSTINELQARIDGIDLKISKPDAAGKKPQSTELQELNAEKARLRKEIGTRERLHQKILDMQVELNDGPREKFEKGEPPIKSEEVQELEAIAKELEDTVKEKRTLADINQRIQSVKDGNKPRPKPKRDTTPAVKEAQKLYREALSLLNAQESIADLKEQLKTGEFKVAVPREKSEITAELDTALREKARLQRAIKDLIDQNRDRSLVVKIGAEIGLALRAVLLSGELGFTGRQFAVWTVNFRTMPTSIKNIYKTVIQGFSEAGAERLNMELRADSRFLDAQRSKLVYREMDHEITGGEEYTQSWLIRKLPILKQFIALNDRLMVTYMNLMTHDVYYSYVETNQHSTREQRTAMAHLINVSSGRGTALGADVWAKSATHIMLAPRFMISRIQAPFTAAKVFKEGDAGQRLFMAKSWGGFLATGTSLLLLASMIPGVEIGDDPESSDFMKIIWGNKRIDIWGGFLQPVQLFMKIFSRILASADLRESKRRGRPKDLKDEIGNFIGNRTAPLVNLLNMLYFERTFSGEKVPLIKDMFEGDVEGIIKDFGIMGKELATPIIIQETVDAYELEGIGGATLSFFLNQAGFGTSTYEIKSSKKTSKF